MSWNSPDIVCDACVEQNGVLRDDADSLPQAGLSDIANILTIDQDPALAFLKVVEAIQETQDRRLARARLAHKSNRGALGDLEGDAIEGCCAGVIREVDVLW